MMNKKLGTVLAAFMLTGVVCVAQSLPTKSQQYAFLKWYLTTYPQRKLSKKIERFENENFSLRQFDDLNEEPMAKYYKVMVNDTDKAFIKLQSHNNNKTRSLQKDSLANIDWHKWTDPDLPVTHISLPVFTRDGSLVFIYNYFHCGGLCGNGHIQIFRRSNNTWQLLKIDFWARWNN